MKLTSFFAFAAVPLSLSGCVKAQPAPVQPTPPPGTATTIQIDVEAKRHPISPYVYGVCYADKNATALNCPVDRYGGNNTSRYNWRLNADNRGKDWYFESIADDDATPGGRVNKFIKADKSQGAKSMVTIPLIGWVAKVNPDRSKLWSFSVQKYGPQQFVDNGGDAGNGNHQDGKRITGNDPNDANVKADPEFMLPWVEQLTREFGPSKEGGVGWYLLDNEPALWFETHRDVAPAGIKMDDLFSRSLATAVMIKTADPTAKVVGPEEWGWTGYKYSGFDSQYGNTYGWHGKLPDRDSHGGTDFAPWYLRRFAQASKLDGGKRLLDVFSLHYYPQGGEFSGDTSPQMQEKRNRSTRSLWDPNYTDETWIADKVQLVPRMKKWVADNYPGTQTGVTEYSWGADEHINGATTQADILGIFGREGVDIATRWTCPDPKTPTFKAIQMYRNYNGNKGTFGDISVACNAPFPDQISAFAAQDSTTNALTVMVIAKTQNSPETPITLDISHFKPGAKAWVCHLTSENFIERQPDILLSGPKVTLRVPAQSVTLLVIPKG